MGKNPLFKIVATVTLHDGSVISILAASRVWNFSEVKTSVFGAAGICGRRLKNMLIKHTVSSEQAIEILQKTDVFADRVSAGLFFRETGDSRNPVEIKHIDRDGISNRPDVSFKGIFSPHFRLIVRNLDMSKLETGPICVGEGPGVMAHRPFLLVVG